MRMLNYRETQILPVRIQGSWIEKSKLYKVENETVDKIVKKFVKGENTKSIKRFSGKRPLTILVFHTHTHTQDTHTPTHTHTNYAWEIARVHVSVIE